MKIDGNKKEKAALAAYDQGDRVLAAGWKRNLPKNCALPSPTARTTAAVPVLVKSTVIV